MIPTIAVGRPLLQRKVVHYCRSDLLIAILADPNRRGRSPPVVEKVASRHVGLSISFGALQI